MENALNKDKNGPRDERPILVSFRAARDRRSPLQIQDKEINGYQKRNHIFQSNSEPHTTARDGIQRVMSSA